MGASAEIEKRSKFRKIIPATRQLQLPVGPPVGGGMDQWIVIASRHVGNDMGVGRNPERDMSGIPFLQGIDQHDKSHRHPPLRMEIIALRYSGSSEALHGGCTDIFSKKRIEVVGVVALVMNRLLDHFRRKGITQVGRETLDDFAHHIVVS